MPEGPEVENVVRSLAPKLTGRTILSVQGFTGPVAGETIQRVSRYGKYILLHFHHGMLQIHLRMTGKLLFNGERTPYTRAEFALDNGILLFDDIRQFGRIRWATELPDQGPDPLEMSAPEFTHHLKKFRGAVKPVLLDQRKLRGVGNIYADEALFAARIHPKSNVINLNGPKLQRLHEALSGILNEAIESGGSSISDYVDGDGRQGSFQKRHQVYGREGEPCPHCQTPIRRMLVAQRGTHFCPRCQAHPRA